MRFGSDRVHPLPRVPFDAHDVRHHPGDPTVLDTFRKTFHQQV
jgi:hypothetical protein